MKPSLPLSVFAGAAHDASGREAAFTPADIDLDAGSDAQARKDAGALRREVDEALEVFRSSGVNLVRVNLDARRLCDAKGNVVEGPGTRLFDIVMDACAHAGLPALLTLMAFKKAPAPSPVEPGSFASFYERGMLLWSQDSTVMQERYVGQFLLRRSGISGRRLPDFQVIAGIRLFDTLDDVLAGVLDYSAPEIPPESPFLDSFLKHRDGFFRTRQDLAASKLEAAFKDHVIRRFVMFLIPEMLHAFGNRTLFVFSKALSADASAEMRKFRDGMEPIAVSTGIIPFVKEFDIPSGISLKGVLSPC
jgi:hypothetical protein